MPKGALHARIGEALEELYGVDVEAHAAELAHHFVQADVGAGAEKLVRYSRMAGERALSAHGYEEALAHFQQALTAKEELVAIESGKETDAETAAILFGLGRAQTAMLGVGHIEEGQASLNRAFDYCAEIGDVARALEVAYVTDMPALPRLAAPECRVVVCRCMSCGKQVREVHPEVATDQYELAPIG